MTPATRERGAVTAELAIGLPAVVLVLVAVLTLAAASSAQMRAQDAARAGARAVAVGEPAEVVAAAVSRVGGPAAEVVVSREGEWVRVTVSRPVAASGPAAVLRATGSAVAWAEP